MQKTRNLRSILKEVVKTRQLESKMLEQKVFDLWQKQFGTPFGTKTTPVSLSDGVLKIYTEYPSHTVELRFAKQQIIANLNTELEKPVLTDLWIELHPVHTVISRDMETEQPQPHRKLSKQSDTDTTRCTTPEELERIEQALAGVTDEKLKKSLRQLFITQSEDNP